MITASRISARLGGRLVLSGAGFSARRGELLGLVGPNGAGKSTLLRVIAGLQAYSGELTLHGRPLAAMPAAERARRIAYLEQGGHSHWPIPVARLAALGRLPHLAPWQESGPEDAAIIARVLAATDLTGLAERPFDTLSGGEKARALIARALAGEPELLLADEPVAALDPAHQLQIMELFRAHCANGGSALTVLHDLRLAARFCHRLLLLDQGRMRALGPPEQVLSAENLARVYGLRLHAETGGPLDLGWERIQTG